MRELGRSPEGRPLLQVTVGPEPERIRPALMIDANLHAVEVCGSSVALNFIERLLRLHQGENGDFPPHLAAQLRQVLVYVIPRVSPDGAEAVLETGAYVRSVPRDRRAHQQHAHWVCSDLDGDGNALLMRQEHPTGEYVESTDFPGLLRPRLPEDPGPYYKLYPEGTIANFDGQNIPSPWFLSDNDVDLNRNFPSEWAPENHQAGAGPFPGSEPESEAVIRFATEHPNIYAWVSFHTFGGVFIRPFGDKPDNRMDPADLAVWRQLGQWAEELTNYPMVSGFEEFTYAPDTPIRGDLAEFALNTRGALAYVVELWDLFEQVGLPRRGKRFVDRYSFLEPEDQVAIAQWDATHNASRVVRPWVPMEHPQLGPVEVGGLDPRIGLWNPPPDRLAEVCDQHAAMLFKVLSLAPQLQFEVQTAAVGGGLREVVVQVHNRGYLPTWTLNTTRSLPINEPLSAWVETEGQVVGPPRLELGHLEGYGRGRYGDGQALYFARSHGSTGSALARFVIDASEATVTVGSCRLGWTSLEIAAAE